MVSAELSKPRRIELILRQIDSLPTLPAVATRLLQLTASDDAHTREVVQMVAADPALTAKVLSLCKTADKGVRNVLTVEHAVKLLGFQAIRNAVLSLKLFELFDAKREDQVPLTPATGRLSGDTARGADPEPFDRAGFWSHSLAVAIVAELIAKLHPDLQDLVPEEAFVCGLLHDMGKLALDLVLPRSYARVIEAAKLRQGDVAEYERRVIGLDHHTAGKRLAEQWGLPHMLQDCLWLHGSAFETLPKLEHRRMIGLITLADTIVRRQLIGFSGNHAFKQRPDELAAQLGLDPALVSAATDRLYDELETRGAMLGLHEVPSRELLMQSVQKANEALGRLNQQLEQRGRQVALQQQVMQAVQAFHAGDEPGLGVQDVLERVMRSATGLLGSGFYAVLYPTRDEQNNTQWLLGHAPAEARGSHFECIDPPPHAPDLTKMDATQPIGMTLAGLMPWLADHLVGADDLRRVQMLPLPSGWGTAAILMHDREKLPPWVMMQPLAGAWGSAVAAAAQFEGARQLSEELAQTSAALAAAQDRLLRQESLARLGEMASGAAHEMNNPLAVISGRSQLLTLALPTGSKDQQNAQLIFQEAHRLSDLITGLHLFADPPKAECRPIDMLALLDEVVRKVKLGRSKRERTAEIYLSIKHELPVVNCDAPLVARILTELIVNALQSNPRSAVNIAAQVEHDTESIVVQVIDDGDGMDERTASHAFDPFFSAKPAGRQVGMGLPRAQQLAIAHGGRIDLHSTPGVGTTASLTLPLRGNAS
jgi:signal transduction histidine kinase/HD-like signal output (HDOD) protein